MSQFKKNQCIRSSKMKKVVSILVLAVMGLSLLTACAAPADDTTEVALLTYAASNETTKYVCDVVQEMGAEKGWTVQFTDTAGDFNKLNTSIEDAITRKVDAIVLPMIDPAQVSKGLGAAEEAGIPVFGLDSAAGNGIMVNVTSDNTSLGTLSAEILAEKIGYKGQIIQFVHDPHPGVRERSTAAEAVFAQYPDITIVERQHVEVPGPLDNARKSMEDFLVSYSGEEDIVGVWAAWDEPALGVLQACQASGRENIYITGVDGQPFAKEEILKDGQFIATVSQDFDGMASKTIELIENYLNGVAPEQDTFKIPGVLFTAESAD
jgi:ribose transport system substrate-binding protein